MGFMLPGRQLNNAYSRLKLHINVWLSAGFFSADNPRFIFVLRDLAILPSTGDFYSDSMYPRGNSLRHLWKGRLI